MNLALQKAAADLAARRKDFEDAMLALELPEPAKLALRAAAGSLGKAHTHHALAQFIDARTLKSSTEAV